MGAFLLSKQLNATSLQCVKTNYDKHKPKKRFEDKNTRREKLKLRKIT